MLVESWLVWKRNVGDFEESEESVFLECVTIGDKPYLVRQLLGSVGGLNKKSVANLVRYELLSSCPKCWQVFAKVNTFTHRHTHFINLTNLKKVIIICYLIWVFLNKFDSSDQFWTIGSRHHEQHLFCLLKRTRKSIMWKNFDQFLLKISGFSLLGADSLGLLYFSYLLIQLLSVYFHCEHKLDCFHQSAAFCLSLSHSLFHRFFPSLSSFSFSPLAQYFIWPIEIVLTLKDAASQLG